MVGAAVARCRKEGATTLLVKTLADSHPSEGYAQMQAFYRAMGFGRLEVLSDLRGPHNPCLLMAKVLAARPV
jgi:hypothetical protein